MIPMALTDVAAAISAACEPRDRWGNSSTPATKIRRVTTDSRNIQDGDLFFAIPGERFDGHQFIREAISRGAVACVCSGAWYQIDSANGTGCSGLCLVVQDTVKALGSLAAYYRRNVMHADTVVVAVTGTNGKTTTKGMIDHVLSPSLEGRAAPKSFNNQLGVPLTLLSAEADDRYLVVEIGSNAPGEVAALAAVASPDVAVITSVGEAHLEGLGDVDGVAAEKASLLAHLPSDGLAVVNIDRCEIRPYLVDMSAASLWTVGMDDSATLQVANVRTDIGCTTFELNLPASRDSTAPDGCFRVEVPMPGAHHALNAAAAFAVARWLDVPCEQIVDRLRSFTPPEGRARVLQIGDLTVVDDTYNANPASMVAAVETLQRVAGFGPHASAFGTRAHKPAALGRRVFVMGDMLELGSESALFHRRAVAAVFDAGIEVLVAVGPHTAEGVQTMNQTSARSVSRTDPVGCTTRVVLCQDAAAACDALVNVLAPGDTVWIKGSRAVGLDRVVEEMINAEKAKKQKGEKSKRQNRSDSPRFVDSF